jgi:hypothetical protein
MKRVIASAITLLCVACGGPSEEPAIGTPGAKPASSEPARANEPPVISKAAIEPEDAGASTELEVAVIAKDPDRDRVSVEIEWYRNGVLVEGQSQTTVPPGTFSRGDRIYAIAFVSDGVHDVSAQTAAISLGNAAPTLRRVRITPPQASALDVLQAEAEVEDLDGDEVELRYRWYRNGQPIADATGPRLSSGTGHRGEQIAVQVQATDGDAEGPWVGSTPVVLANAAPGITTQPNYALSGSGQYSYEVAAVDPDGDRPLKYELIQGPPGMSVDVASGRVTWRVPADAKGVYPIEVAVSDPYGGKTTQQYSLAVDWGQAPAAARPSATPPPAARDVGEEDAEESDEDYTDENLGEEPVDDEF